MAMPSSVTVEIEFTAGVWTDVTAYVDGQASGSTRFGRTSPFGAPSPGTLTITLANEDGRFTPRRQILADGVTAHPYWPNVVPRKRIRVAYVVGGTPYYRFTGYIKGWPPTMVNGDVARVTISASTVDDRLSRVTMQAGLPQELLKLAPLRYWPLSDPSGPASEQSGNIPASPLFVRGSGQAPSWGDSSTPVGMESAPTLKLAPGSSSTGQYLQSLSPLLPSNEDGALMIWFNLGTALPAWPQTLYTTTQSAIGLWIDTSGQLNAGDIPGVSFNKIFYTSAPLNDGQWHCVIWEDSTATSIYPGVFLDGVQVAVGTGTWELMLFQLSSAWPGSCAVFGSAAPWLSQGATTGSFQGNLGPIALWPTPLATQDIADIYQAGYGWAGETVDTRIERFLGYGGLAAADWNVDASAVLLDAYQQGGKDIVSACQDATTTEGGGAVFYVGTDGKVQFRSRSFRNPTVGLALTVDAEADLDGSNFQPSYDDTLIVNQVQGTRASTSDTQTVTDAASKTANGLISSSFTSWAASDADVLSNAQDQVARQRNPNYQIPQVTVDLATATTANLYQSVAATDVGDRIRLANVPAGAAPTTQVDLYVEGWSDTFSTDQYSVAFDTSPADSPPWEIWDHSSYGRWQCDTQTLSSALTAGAATVVIASAAGSPTFTTDPTAYPLKIAIGEEHLQLNGPPGGAASPQTFTGVTRGVDGTAAAAQAAGSAVDLAPAGTWTL